MRVGGCIARYFIEYMFDNDDDSPLYIFDYKFAQHKVVRTCMARGRDPRPSLAALPRTQVLRHAAVLCCDGVHGTHVVVLRRASTSSSTSPCQACSVTTCSNTSPRSAPCSAGASPPPALLTSVTLRLLPRVA